MESLTIQGNSPVGENINVSFEVILEYLETRIARGNLPALTGKAKYLSRSIVNKYREGKVKRTPARGVK